MALDTRDKRASAIGWGLSFRAILPNPDAPAEDQGDRQQLAWSYRGILADAATYVTGAVLRAPWRRALSAPLRQPLRAPQRRMGG